MKVWQRAADLELTIVKILGNLDFFSVLSEYFDLSVSFNGQEADKEVEKERIENYDQKYTFTHTGTISSDWLGKLTYAPKSKIAIPIVVVPRYFIFLTCEKD
jgi:hypothetical protein